MAAAAKNTAARSIKVSLAQQIVEVYEGSTRVFRFDCVTGDSEHPTERGVFKALHQYHGIVPLGVVRTARGSVGDWFGSHGCVRLSEADARALYGWAAVGTTVQVL